MLKCKDIVLRLKNLVRMRNVYDCARPILLLLALFGLGASRITKTGGVYSLHNTRYSIILAVFTVLLFAPYNVVPHIRKLFKPNTDRSLYDSVLAIIQFLALVLRLVTVGVASIRTHVCCKDLDKVFQIINTIDTKLQQENIKIKQWKITLAVTVLGLVTVNYAYVAVPVYLVVTRYHLGYKFVCSMILQMMYFILFHLCYVWVILFQLIIYDRFVSINKLFLQNARVPNRQTVGSSNLRDDYLLRRLSVARHLDEQLSEAIVLFSNVFRYVIAGLLMHPIIETLHCVIFAFFDTEVIELQLACLNMFTQCSRIVAMISICQAYKNQRRVLTARLRHLISHETDRRIVRQVQRYIWYNATAVPGLIDFQFTEVDNVLLFTIIDIIASNAFVIYSYAR